MTRRHVLDVRPTLSDAYAAYKDWAIARPRSETPLVSETLVAWCVTQDAIFPWKIIFTAIELLRDFLFRAPQLDEAATHFHFYVCAWIVCKLDSIDTDYASSFLRRCRTSPSQENVARLLVTETVVLDAVQYRTQYVTAYDFVCFIAAWMFSEPHDKYNSYGQYTFTEDGIRRAAAFVLRDHLFVLQGDKPLELACACISHGLCSSFAVPQSATYRFSSRLANALDADRSVISAILTKIK